MTSPPETPAVSRSAFWSGRYRTGEAGWDKGRPAPPILRLAKLLKPGRVAVVGCGRGHEAAALSRAGWEAVGFDFAPEAVAAARRRRSAARFEVADLFQLPERHPSAFDAVCEHTCFCAIDPARRGEYVKAVAGILKPGGVLFGLFYAHAESGGPPFRTDAAEVRRLFSRRFRIARLEVPSDSFPNRAGNELLAEFYLRRRRQRR